MTDRTELFDVLEIQIANPSAFTVVAEGKSERNAEAIVSMAVMRRGVEHSFFTVVPHGRRPDPND